MADVAPVQKLRGTAAQNAAVTLAEGVIVYLTDTYQIAVHDGSTAGGHIFGVIPDLLDEDDMSSDSATQAATQRSIKAYYDSAPGFLCETWQIKTAFSGDGGSAQVVSGSGVWGRKTNALLIGDGTTESSGTFTWPESGEGVWQAVWNPKINAGSGDGYTLKIRYSQDGGSNWRTLAEHQTYSPADPQSVCLVSEHFEVNDYSQCQLRIVFDDLNSDSSVVPWESQLIFERKKA